MKACVIFAILQVSPKVYRLQFMVIVKRVVTSINGNDTELSSTKKLVTKNLKMGVLCSRSTCERSHLCARVAYQSAYV